MWLGLGAHTRNWRLLLRRLRRVLGRWVPLLPRLLLRRIRSRRVRRTSTRTRSRVRLRGGRRASRFCTGALG